MILKQIDFRHSIANQLFKVLFGMYLVIAVIVTVIQLATVYYNEKEAVAKEIQKLPVTLGPGISTSLWTFNDRLLQSILMGINTVWRDICLTLTNDFACKSCERF